MKGHGFFSDVFSSVKRLATGAIDRVKGVFKGVRQNYSPSVRRLLAEIGDLPVIEMSVRRDPVQSLITKALNFISLGKFDQLRKQYNYDDLFHLGVEVTVRISESNEYTRRYVIEKNEVINVGSAKAYTDKTQTWRVPMNGTTTISTLLANTQLVMGSNFFTYDPFTNNCQDFILSLLVSNGYATPKLREIVKQPIEELVSKLPSFTGKIAKAVTDLGAIANVAFEGQGSQNAFMKQLKDAGVSADEYLKLARRFAKRAGYPHKKIEFSNKANKKLMIESPSGQTVYFGAVGYNDFVLYSLQGNKQLADEKRRLYLNRALKIKGDWRSDKYSPNCLAVSILWRST
jgi:hypothetical protein